MLAQNTLIKDLQMHSEDIISSVLIAFIATFLVIALFAIAKTNEQRIKVENEVIGKVLIWQGKKILVMGLDGARYNVAVSSDDKSFPVTSIDKDVIQKLYQTQVVEKNP